MKTIKIGKVKIEYDCGNVRIVESYKIRDEQQMIYILKEFKNRTGYKSKRTLESWVTEWKAHNLMYRLGLFRTHTNDCDLEENEKKHRLIIYKILGGIS